MPTRYLKPGIRDSGHIEFLSNCPDAEILYYRLLATVDDFGRFDGRGDMIKAYCFPIRKRATADKCIQWLAELHNAGLSVIYVVDGKEYLQITKWDNKPRAECSKYPDPPTDVYKCPQMLPVTVTETVTETGHRPRKRAAPTGASEFENLFWRAYPKKIGKAQAEKAWKRVANGNIDAIIDGLQRATDHWKSAATDPQFIPNPATWLNGKRWMDEIHGHSKEPSHALDPVNPGSTGKLPPLDKNIE